MKRPRNVLIQYNRRHHLKLCMIITIRKKTFLKFCFQQRSPLQISSCFLQEHSSIFFAQCKLFKKISFRNIGFESKLFVFRCFVFTKIKVLIETLPLCFFWYFHFSDIFLENTLSIF